MKALILVLLVHIAAWAALVEVDTTYRVTEVKQAERIFGIALLTDDPNETQNDVYLEPDTKIYRVIKFKNGLTKDYPVEQAKFFTILRKGDIVRVHAGRDWDGSLRAYQIWLKS